MGEERDGAAAEWRRSSWCHTTDCVEVSFTGAQVRIRQTGSIEAIVCGPAEWVAFLGGVRSGEFWHPPRRERE